MATVTRTCSMFSPVPKSVHTGVLCNGSALSLSVSFSASGRLKMLQVPNNCTIVDFWLRIQTTETGAANTFEFGTSHSRSGIMSLTTITQTYSFSASISLDTLTLNIIGDSNHGAIRAPGGTRNDVTAITDLMPVRISLTATDIAHLPVWLIGKTGKWSTSAFFTCMIFYTMDGMTGRTELKGGS